MSDEPKVRHANGHPIAAVRQETEAQGELGIGTATDGDGNICVKFSEPVSMIRMPRLAVAQFLNAIAKEARIKIELELLP